MKQTKTMWGGDKFAKVSDAQMPGFIAAYRERQDRRAKVDNRIILAQTYAFFVIPALTLFIWFVAHCFAVSDGWIAFGQSYVFCVLPVCVMILYVAKAWHDARPHLSE